MNLRSTAAAVSTLAVLGASLTACSSNHQIVYTVTAIGSDYASGVTYNVGDDKLDSRQDSMVHLPWSRTVNKSFDNVYLNTQLSGTGTVHCEIKIDGDIVAQSNAVAPSVAECMP